MAENRYIRRSSQRRIGRLPGRFAHRSNPILLCVALFALALQILVVQTHIHNGTRSGADFDAFSYSSGIPQAAPAGDDTHPAGIPVKDDSSDCPICQAFAHAGALLHAPQSPGWVPSVTVERLLFFSVAIQPDLHISRPWFGRAPPAAPALNG